MGMKKDSKRTIQGEIVTTGKGMGFIDDLDDNKPSIVVEPGYLNTALNGDLVEVSIIPGKKSPLKPGSPIGEVVRVIQRAKERYVGTVDIDRGLVFIVPDDKKIYTDFIVTPDSAKKFQLKKDDKVQVNILSWTDPKKNPECEIVKIIGSKGENNVEMESIVLEKGFDWDYPHDVIKEAESIDRKIPQDEVLKRRDFRDTLTFTIDPEDAKDFDDAISYKEIGAGRYEVGVHIADVSHYVREGTALDREAKKRGCSIYLVDRTIPMLPEVLSNDVCSLNPHEDKLVFSAVFDMDLHGKVHGRWFGKGIINSAHRFTYETAQDSIVGKSDKLAKELKTLNDIAKKLQQEKFSKGAIEFEQDEIKFKLDENGKPIGVYRKVRFDAHKLVEEYMLLANREVARFIFDSIKKKGKRDTGSIYRIHDIPDKERMMELSDFAKALGYTLKIDKEGNVTAQAIKSLMHQIEGTPHETMLKTATIRSMQKAIYSTKNIGHFGLAFDFYTHFTSPIRRYPDLLVHRILEKHIHDEPFGDRDVVAFQHIADSSTEREISAAEAERASKKLKQVEYMSSRVGKIFTGTISGVTEWGMYIEDKESGSEGMVKIRDIGNDFWEFSKKTYSIVGQKSKKKYSLGDEVKFKVAGFDLDKKTLDYTLV
jgi:ribonuclease R